MRIRFPRLFRIFGIAATAALVTSLVLYGVFMETDYGKALFFTYDEMWDIAEKQAASGNLREAERLVRHIVASEENRVTLKFGLFVLFAGPDYLVRAQLKLAELHWRQGRLADADAGYRDALGTVAALYGPVSWRHALAHFRYAEFLAATGRPGDTRGQLDRAEEAIQRARQKWQEDGGPFWEEDEEANRRPILEDLSTKIDALRGRPGLGRNDKTSAFRTAPNGP